MARTYSGGGRCAFASQMSSVALGTGSVVGPPTAAWVAKDESWAIVTSATKAGAQAKDGIAPDDRVSVIDLTSNPPKITQSLTAGLGATTVRLSPDGKLALIANRTEGTVSVFSVADKSLTAIGKVDLGNKGSLPSGIVFSHDGRHALLSRSGDNMVSVLNVDGTNVTVDPRPVTTGMAPYTMDSNAAGTLAVVSNMGRGDGDEDSVSLIDLTSKPFRVVDTVGVNDRTWLDQMGHIHTDQLHLVERYKPVGNTLQLDVTIDDPGAYTRPWSSRRTFSKSTTGFMRYMWVCSVRDNYEHYDKVGRSGNSGDTTFKK